MLVDEFDFLLPEELIAKSPAFPRDSSRLLRVLPDGFRDHIFSDITGLLKPNDLLVFNDTSVIPARLFGRIGKAKAEVTLHKKVEDNIWQAFAKPARKFKPGKIFQIADDFYAHILDKDGPEVTLQFVSDNFYSDLDEYGLPPLPPYIKRQQDELAHDRETYQTIYAKNKGAVAAPTAGLHFTDELFSDLNEKNIASCFVTLHVGAGTFLPVKVDNVEEHQMHSEFCTISKNVAEQIMQTKNNGGRVVSVGTTSLRLLESAARGKSDIAAFEGDTDIFIYPGYEFKIVDALITNFHLPRSTLFMLVSAFAGTDIMKSAYEHAIENKYRFFSYGDACLLERA